MNKVYFPGLNGIRAIAALIVLIFHIDLALPAFGLKEIGIHKNNMAGYGVTMFFCIKRILNYLNYYMKNHIREPLVLKTSTSDGYCAYGRCIIWP
ncbi:MAG: hypothetical protein ACP5PS_09925 [Bacteroidales bacterium]